MLKLFMFLTLFIPAGVSAMSFDIEMSNDDQMMAGYFGLSGSLHVNDLDKSGDITSDEIKSYSIRGFGAKYNYENHEFIETYMRFDETFLLRIGERNMGWGAYLHGVQCILEQGVIGEGDFYDTCSKSGFDIPAAGITLDWSSLHVVPLPSASLLLLSSVAGFLFVRKSRTSVQSS